MMGAAALRRAPVRLVGRRPQRTVAVVNESFVRRTHPIAIRSAGGFASADRRHHRRRGADLQMQDVEDLDGAGFYVSMLQRRPFAFRLMAIGTGDPLQ